MSTVVHAWTACDVVKPYPPYVNIKIEGDSVTITVRSPAKPDGSCGDSAQATMSRAEYETMMKEGF